MKKLIIILFLVITFQAISQKRIGIVGAATAEIMLDLNMTDEVVCVDETVKKIDTFKNKTNLGSDKTTYLQKLIDLKLSHFICSDIACTKEEYEKLKKSGVKIIKLNSKQSIPNIIKNLNLLAKTFGKQDKAKEIENEIKVKQSGIEFASYMGNSGVKTLYLNIVNKDSIYVAGKNTPANSMITIALGKNICKQKGWQLLKDQNYKPQLIICNRTGFDLLGGEKNLAFILSKKGIEVNNAELYVVNATSFLAFGTKMPEEAEKLVSFYSKMK